MTRQTSINGAFGLVALLALSPVVAKCTRDYFNNKK